MVDEAPNEGSPHLHIVRLLAFLLILDAILRKNYGAAQSVRQTAASDYRER